MGKKEAPSALAAAEGLESEVNDSTEDLNVQSEEPIEPTFEQKVFERMREESKAFAATADWEKLWSDYQTDLQTERGRAFTFITYEESMNPNFMQLVTDAGLQGAVSPLHDRDYWPDGTYKKPHFHNVLYFPGKTSYKKVKDLVTALGGVMLQPVQNITGLLRYFAHMDIDPKNRICDRGKVHYSPDDIVSFGGFDVKHHIKATQTQISKALAELYEIIREKDFTAYSTFVDYVYCELHEYEFVMSNQHVCTQISMYIRSRYAVAHEGKERKLQEALIETQGRQIAELRGALSEAVSYIQSMTKLVTTGEV